MTHQLRAQTSIASERQTSWRREASADRRAAATGSDPISMAAGAGFRLAFVGRMSIADLRRRIAGASAQA
jgi:hypothetical protein